MTYRWRDGVSGVRVLVRLGGSAFVGAVLLTACDPGHHFADLQVAVLLRPDSTGALVVAGRDLDGPTADETALQLAASLGVGSPSASASTVEGFAGTEIHIGLSAVSETGVALDIDALRAAALKQGLEPTSTMFVSLCTSATDGWASGTGADVGIVHLSSCATWGDEVIGTQPTNALLRLRFDERHSPWKPSAIGVSTVALFGIGASVTHTRLRTRRARRIAAGVVALSSIVLALWGIWLFGTAGWTGGSWLATGQSLDTELTRTLRIVGGAAMAASLVVALARRLQHRRVPPPTTTTP